ncbi:hypothetical protein, partial [Iodobacter sp. BJB302]|uniref:hypothetical protein n=1 Tax=Iodobacter sp. BJB302 TaxID=1506510 RepID=UPI001C558CEF
ESNLPNVQLCSPYFMINEKKKLSINYPSFDYKVNSIGIEGDLSLCGFLRRFFVKIYSACCPSFLKGEQVHQTYSDAYELHYLENAARSSRGDTPKWAR